MNTHEAEARPAPAEAAGDREVGKSPPPRGDGDLQQAVSVFLLQRPQLLRIAGRILRDAGEAEDVVQEAWLRWQRTDRRTVTNPPGFLATATSRLAINVIQAARTRHETAAGPGLDHRGDTLVATETTAEWTEAAELALRVLLERLTPAERGAYVLRRGFDYPYRKVADVLRLSAPNARQLVSRADAGIRSRGRRPVDRDAHRRLVRAFLAAARAGEFGGLEALLAADIRRAAG